MKQLLALIGFSLVAGAPPAFTQTSNAGSPSSFQTSLAQYYKIASLKDQTAGAERVQLETQISSFDSKKVDIPSQTAAWSSALVKKSLAAGDSGFIDGNALPSNLYAKGPPEKWIDFLTKALTPASKVHCHVNDEMTNCQEQRIRGKSLEPVLKQIAFASEKDSNLTPAQSQRLKNLLNSFYKALSLKTRSVDWNVSPGLALQLGARLGDDRAAARAIQLVDDYLKKPDRAAIGNFQDSLFALQLYNQREGANLDSRLAVEVGGKINEALESKNVPEFMKTKLQALQRSVLENTSAKPGSATSEATH